MDTQPTFPKPEGKLIVTNSIMAGFYYPQRSSLDNPNAVLRNLLHCLDIAFHPLAVEQAVFAHPEFPFISLAALQQILQDWGLETLPVKVNPADLPHLPLPALTFFNGEPGSFAVLQSCHQGEVHYIHPKDGCAQATVEGLMKKCNGVVLLVHSAEVGNRLNIPPACPSHTHSRPKVALVTTLVNAEQTLPSFLQYHLGIGIDHLFLFFDDPNDAMLKQVASSSQITVLVNDENLRSQWRTGRLYEGLQSKEECHDVRQLFHVEIAIQLARAKGIDWLLHVDVDELFYLSNNDLHDHFAWLDSQNITQITYPNYEAVTERMEIGDYFREVTLFKKNPMHLSQQAKQWLSAWNNPVSNLPENQNQGRDLDLKAINPHFLAYSNGKSAAKVEKDLLPWGAHQFSLRKGNVYYQKKHVVDLQKITGSPSPIILHYAECGFEHFWRKYRHLGNLPDYFPGGQKVAQTIPFRTEARDVVKQNNVHLARSFYERKVLVDDAKTVAQLTEMGVFCRINNPSERITNGGTG